MSLPTVSFRRRHQTFRSEVLQQLTGPRGCAERFGPARHKAIVMPVLILSVFGLLLSRTLGGPVLVLAEAALQILCLIAALGIAHDASHAALSRWAWANRLGTFVFDLVGVNGYIWHFDHVTAHHATPNVSRYDANLYGWGPIRLDPYAPRRPWHAFQHLYAPVVYLGASLFKVYLGDLLAFRRARVDAYLARRHSAGAWGRLVLFKLWAVTFTLLLPWWATGNFRLVGIGYLIGHACNGLLMGAIFQPTHTNELVTWPKPDAAGQLATSFDEHVFATTADFAVDSAWVTWLAGGLNIHAVHHLFPKLPHLALVEAASVVSATAQRHGLHYRTFPTWRSALRSHFRALRALGSEDAAPATAYSAGGLGETVAIA